MIEQIFIENYKSIRNAKIRLNSLNVLIGSNGVGKSNFISFFELVQAMLNQRLGSYILSRGGIERCYTKEENNQISSEVSLISRIPMLSFLK